MSRFQQIGNRAGPRADLEDVYLRDVTGADFTGALNVPAKYLKD
jgi:hypothetical protein